jgi:hypothetical protein
MYAVYTMCGSGTSPSVCEQTDQSHNANRVAGLRVDGTAKGCGAVRGSSLPEEALGLRHGCRLARRTDTWVVLSEAELFNERVSPRAARRERARR